MPMIKVRQELREDSISEEERPAKLREALSAVKGRIVPGSRIGITVGSRGIDQIDGIVRGIVSFVREQRGEAFIVPCMGSHGFTAAGQELILNGLNVTERAVGARIVSRDELIQVGVSEDGGPVYMDRFLFECDGVIVLNRIKAHTAFHGKVESGLQKMMAVGMGKQAGAASCHRDGFTGMEQKIIGSAKVVQSTGKILFGVAVLENAGGKLCRLEAVPGEEIAHREPELLLEAKKLMPKIPFDQIDLLIVDEMGKDVSGSGMDTNVIGRYPTPGMAGGLQAEQLVVLSLTKASEGSGHGMGFADFISAKLFCALDLEKTYPNGLTNKTSAPAKIPPIMPNDRDAIRAAIHCCSREDPNLIRAVRIRNTHSLKDFYISPALWKGDGGSLRMLSEASPVLFDRNFNIIADW